MRAGAVVAYLATVLAVVSDAQAGGFTFQERSARAQGLSFAGATAGSGGLQSMGFNPAALGLIDEGAFSGEIAGGFSLVDTTYEGQPNVGGVPIGGEVDAGRFSVRGNGYAGFRLWENVLIGFGTYSPFHLSTSHDPGWLGQFDALTSKIETIQFSPSVAYQPMQGLTLAVSANILHTDIRLTTAAGQTDVDTTDVSFSAGILWKATESATIGVAYHHGYDLSAGGTFTPGGAAPLSVRAKAELPAIVSAGIAVDVTEDFRLMGELQWHNWSVFDQITVSLSAGGLLQSNVQNYDDAFFLAFGGEYDFLDDALTLRAGVAWDETPTNTGAPTGVFPAATNPFATNRTAALPDEDRIWLSLGGSYKITNYATIDLSYSYVFALDDAFVGFRNGPAGSQISYDGYAHSVSIGGSVKF